MLWFCRYELKDDHTADEWIKYVDNSRKNRLSDGSKTNKTLDDVKGLVCKMMSKIAQLLAKSPRFLPTARWNL